VPISDVLLAKTNESNPSTGCFRSPVSAKTGNLRAASAQGCFSLFVGLTGEERKYEMEHRGKSIPENRRLQLKYGKATRPFRMAEVSNSPFTDVRLRE
jgi:hypothetical protein